MRTRVFVSVVAALFVLTVGGQAATSATTTVPPGTDAQYDAAYNAAAPGDTLVLTNGAYGTWTTPGGSKSITVRAGVGTRPVFRQISVQADNLHFDGITIDGGGILPNPNMAGFETGGNSNVHFVNGAIGNITNQKGALLGGQASPASLGIVIDNVHFGPVRVVGGNGVHNECVYLMAPGTVIKNSYFEGTCGNTGAILTQRGSWWGQQPFHGLTFTGNTFERQLFDHGSILFGNHCGDVGAVCRDIVIRGNTFHPTSMPQNATPGLTYVNSFESCNTPQVNLPGFTHEACNPPPPTTTATTTAPTTTAPATTAPPPPAAYHPACEPTCDQQIETEKARGDALAAQLVTVTAQRDSAETARARLADKLARIDAVVQEP